MFYIDIILAKDAQDIRVSLPKIPIFLLKFVRQSVLVKFDCTLVFKDNFL